MTYYQIVRFRFNGTPKVVKRYLTLEEAQAHCARYDSSSHGGADPWFDGYEEMR